MSNNRIWYGLGILSLFPFLILCFFLHPVGVHEWDWVSRNFMEIDYNWSFWEEQLYWYNSVLGRYTSTAMMSLTYLWFDISRFQIFILSSIVLLFLSVYLFVRQLFGTKYAMLITIGLGLLYMDQMTGVFEDFYCYSCVLTYQYGAIFFFLFLAVLTNYLKKNGSLWPVILLTSMIILTVGTNEISLIGMNGCLFFLTTSTYYIARKNKTSLPDYFKLFLYLLFISLLFSMFEILAPGNFNRMEGSPNANNLWLTLFLTGGIFGINLLRWFSETPLILLAILYIPIGLQLSNKGLQKLLLFQQPFWVLTWVLSFHLLSLFLLFWSVGDEALPERVLDLIFLLSLPGLLIFWQGILHKAVEKKLLKSDFAFHPIIKSSLFAFIVFHLFFQGLSIDRSSAARQTTNYLSIIQTDSKIGAAWLEILNGRAINYHLNQSALYETVKKCQSDTCLVLPPKQFPKLIYDQTYDRKIRHGEMHLGKVMNDRVKIVKYQYAQ